MGQLTVEEVDKYLLQIGTNSKYVVLYRNGTEIHLTLNYPSSQDRLRGEFLYKNSYDLAIKEGLLPSAKLEEILKARGVFTKEDEYRLSKLENQLEAQNVLLKKTKNVEANKDRIKSTISEFTKQIYEIKVKRYSRLAISAEARASEVKHSYLCWACCRDFQGNLLWLTYEDYLQDSDIDFKNNILNEFLDFNSGLSQDIIRFIARSNIWRARYIHSTKCSDPLFGTAVANYTVDQLSLVYWSNYYQQIYEMMPDDRPSDAIIDNDEELDKYMSRFFEEKSKEADHRRLKKHTRGSLSAFDSEEVIVTKAHELYQEIKYDKPREAARVKDRTDLKKRTGKKFRR